MLVVFFVIDRIRSATVAAAAAAAAAPAPAPAPAVCCKVEGRRKKKKKEKEGRKEGGEGGKERKKREKGKYTLTYKEGQESVKAGRRPSTDYKLVREKKEKEIFVLSGESVLRT
ncbi:hypothetical protein M0802_009906 [Mischocyttarus mexicanus]|nr:hypothetical protein M0802_009906 [Mischocyttarus mexicanus]